MAQLDSTIVAGQGGHLTDHQTIAGKANYVYDALDYGAVGDGTTDDASAIQSAVTAAEADTYGTLFLPPKQFLIKTALTVDDINISAAGAELLVHDDVTGDAVTIGSTTSTDYKTLNLPAVIRDNRLWSKSTPTIGSDRGVVIAGADGCIVTVDAILDFSYGLVFEGDGNGVSYNTTTIRRLTNNAVNLYLDGKNSGWANQNVFIGGRFTHSTEGESAAVVGTRQIQIGSNKAKDSSYGNDNLFLGCSLEGSIFDFQLECWGSRNTFIDCRWETGSPLSAGKVSWQGFDSSNFAEANLIIGGAAYDEINYTIDSDADINNLHRLHTLRFHNIVNNAYVWFFMSSNDDLVVESIKDSDFRWRLRGDGASAATGEMEFDVWDGSAYQTQLRVKDGYALLGQSGGKVGFYGTAPAIKPTVTGARDDGTALADLLTELATLGLITDSSTAS